MVMVHTDEESTWLIKELSNFSIETLILKNISTLDNYVSNNKEVSSLFIVPGVNASNKISAFNGQLTFFETHYWLVETVSVEQFKVDFDNTDVPINSNFLAYNQNQNGYIDLYDVYRPFAMSELRYNQQKQ